MTDALSTHYADALADAVFADNAGIEPEEAIRQLNDAVAVIASSRDLQSVLESPAVARRQKTDLTGKLLSEAGSHRLIQNFIKVLIEHRRTHQLTGIKDSFEEAVNKRQGYVKAEIVSARKLTEEQREELLTSLAASSGKKIRPVYRVDPSILGGAIVRYGSQEFDGSLTGRLQAMRRRLAAVS